MSKITKKNMLKITQIQRRYN